jgi:hypothetical protein
MVRIVGDFAYTKKDRIMRLVNPDKEINLTAQMLQDISELSGAAGYGGFGSAFHSKDTSENNSIVWNIRRGTSYASIWICYCLNTRTIEYNTTDYESKSGKVDFVRGCGQYSLPVANKILGAAAALGIPVTCTGEYFESERPEEEE